MKVLVPASGSFAQPSGSETGARPIASGSFAWASGSCAWSTGSETDVYLAMCLFIKSLFLAFFTGQKGNWNCCLEFLLLPQMEMWVLKSV